MIITILIIKYHFVYITLLCKHSLTLLTKTIYINKCYHSEELSLTDKCEKPLMYGCLSVVSLPGATVYIYMFAVPLPRMFDG